MAGCRTDISVLVKGNATDATNSIVAVARSHMCTDMMQLTALLQQVTRTRAHQGQGLAAHI